MRILLITVYSCLLCIGFRSFGQTDFNNYSPLQSRGEVPSMFIGKVHERLSERQREEQAIIVDEIEQALFAENIEYGIDRLLNSGLITYGDPISLYVNDVAQILLQDNTELKNELQFFTVRSNAVNAFSTHQGIIFVTTGLMAQLSCEADLAFILAHEIVHYQKSHVVKSFVHSRSVDFDEDWLLQMSTYSQDQEFEADEKAITIYQNAGYDKSKLTSAFDVLKFSHLPFDEIKVPFSYFSKDGLFIPESKYPNDDYEIEANDTDDEYSSHPGVSKRIKRVKSKSQNHGNWGDKVNTLGDSRFQEVRDIARYEWPRNNILSGNFSEAIYSIYLLEQERPNSMYLQRLKAQTWLALSNYNKSRSKFKDNAQGEVARVHDFLSRLTLFERTTVAIRMVYDIYKEYPNDDEISAIFLFMTESLAGNKKFDLNDYYDVSYDKALKLSENDSLTQKELAPEDEEEVLSKYDRIKKSQVKELDLEKLAENDFAEYLLWELKQDSIFQENLLYFESLISTDDSFANITEKQAKQVPNQVEFRDLHLGVERIVLLEPKPIIYSDAGIDNVRSEKFQEKLNGALSEGLSAAGLNGEILGSVNFDKNGTEEYNMRSMLYTSLLQNINSNYAVFPLDYGLLKDFKEKYNTAHVMLTFIEHEYDPVIPWGIIAGAAYVFPYFPVVASYVLPYSIIRGNYTRISFLVLNTETGQVECGQSKSYNESLSKWNLANHFYEYFYYLQIK
ncbi:MAG: M48 family metallopeptidase [bacterium]|nr:M48 family metallopeptidase [bacterium]